MRSTFYGFEIAKTGLFASQRWIDLTGHNIANANTAGYTRQRLAMSSVELTMGAEHFKEVTTGYSGAGVRIDGIEQVRSVFLDRQYRRENGTQEMWSNRADSLGYIEQLFDETKDGALSTSINAFFTSVQSLTMNPESKEYRTNMMQNAMKMTDTFNHLHSQLNDKLLDQNSAVKTTADQVNDLAKNIAGMNDQIFRYELGGDNATDLRDKRNLLLDQLSGLVDISYSEDNIGRLTVTLDGKALVSHVATTHIDSTLSVANPVTGVNDFYGLTWADDNSAVNITSGQLRGYLDMRDNTTADNMGIPYMIGKLNTLAATIAHEFNAIQVNGFTLPNGVNASVAGANFFTDPTTLTAANFTVDASIRNNVYLIAASSELVTTDALKGNNKNALEMVKLQNALTIPGIGSLEGYVKGLVAEIGVETSHTNTMFDGQKTLVGSIEKQKQSVSGVSIDEEMTNLVKFQHTYSASARVITAIDEYLDVLINKMGLVGR